MKAIRSQSRPGHSRIVDLGSFRKKSTSQAHNLICACVEGWHVIPFAEISHCSAESNYVKIHFGPGNSVLASKTLRAVEGLLPGACFVKCHQSHLVAIDRIRLVKNQSLFLETGIELPIARNRKNAIKEAILQLGVRLE